MTDNWDNLPAPLELDNPLWRYALIAWSCPKVEQACLELQARNWSVTRILAAGWLAVEGRDYETEAAIVQRWREQMTNALRMTRKQIPRHQPALSSLRKQLANAELEAERVELALAYESLRRPGKADTGKLTQAERIRANLRAVSPTHNFDQETGRLLDALVHHLPQDSSYGADKP
ncbi:TIGR02444 family protein [Marinobacter zhejiangensis]|uniref:TIGR02444 family protein n=1 Tax=Marinobacter zhejiangensis TaxID=488535 RepID=A0A1I4MC73_9GAMM|nr:TIGR02444 family protein [Marinobacter zhejiangensis]SFM00962.1 TIGR02444 family protein [Marinobacter zhejiangensis]